MQWANNNRYLVGAAVLALLFVIRRGGAPAVPAPPPGRVDPRQAQRLRAQQRQLARQRQTIRNQARINRRLRRRRIRRNVPGGPAVTPQMPSTSFWSGPDMTATSQEY